MNRSEKMKMITNSIVFRVALNVLMILLLAVAVLMNISLFTKCDALAVVSGSMEPTLPYGSLIIIAPQQTYFEGDVVTFRSSGNEEVKRFTHRIVSIADGFAATKGDASTSIDPEPTALSRAEGKVLFSVPYVGFLVMAFGSPKVKIAAVVLVIVWLAVELEFARRRKRELEELKENEDTQPVSV